MTTMAVPNEEVFDVKWLNKPAETHIPQRNVSALVRRAAQGHGATMKIIYKLA